MIHELKTHPAPFASVENGEKTFEIREDDRGFEVGDWLHLRAWDPETKEYTGNDCMRIVCYLVHGPAWGLSKNLCVMGIRRQ